MRPLSGLYLAPASAILSVPAGLEPLHLGWQEFPGGATTDADIASGFRTEEPGPLGDWHGRVRGH